MKNGIVPSSLKLWFSIHFIADILFAVPMMVVPEQFLLFWGLDVGESLPVRLAAAALIGIGGNSFLMRKKNVDVYLSMLNLKILWSLSAIVGIILSIVEGGPNSLFIFLGIFASFSILWIFYRIKLENGRY